MFTVSQEGTKLAQFYSQILLNIQHSNLKILHAECGPEIKRKYGWGTREMTHCAEIYIYIKEFGMTSTY